MRLRTWSVLALAAAALVLAACGGDEDDEGGSASGRSGAKAEFIAAADEVCADFRDRSRPVNRRFAETVAAARSRELRGERLQSALAEISRDGAGLGRRQRRGLGALEPPDDASELWSDVLATLDDQIEGLGNAGDAAAAGDFARFRSEFGRLQAAAEEVRPRLREYGFEVCGTPPGS